MGKRWRARSAGTLGRTISTVGGLTYRSILPVLLVLAGAAAACVLAALISLVFSTTAAIVLLVVAVVLAGGALGYLSMKYPLIGKKVEVCREGIRIRGFSFGDEEEELRWDEVRHVEIIGRANGNVIYKYLVFHLYDRSIEIPGQFLVESGGADRFLLLVKNFLKDA
jgi:hypothetical protein